MLSYAICHHFRGPWFNGKIYHSHSLTSIDVCLISVLTYYTFGVYTFYCVTPPTAVYKYMLIELSNYWRISVFYLSLSSRSVDYSMALELFEYPLYYYSGPFIGGGMKLHGSIPSTVLLTCFFPTFVTRIRQHLSVVFYYFCIAI